MSCDPRFLVARTRLENVTSARVLTPASGAVSLLAHVASEIKDVLFNFPVLRLEATSLLCAAFTTHLSSSAALNIASTELATLIDALLSGASVSEVELDVCADKMVICLHNKLGSALDVLTLHLAANCMNSAGCGHFFLSVLHKLARENSASSPESKHVDDVFCRCDVSLQKYGQHALPLRWLDAKAFLRQWQVAKARRERIQKGFGTTAGHSIERRYRLQEKAFLLSFYIEEDSLWHSNHRTANGKCDVQKYLPWNTGLGVPLNFLMAMYIARPQFVYQCMQNTHALSTVVSTIIAEFGAFNLRQNPHTTESTGSMHFPMAKCLFLTTVMTEWEGTLTFRPLPEPLRSVFDSSNQQSWTKTHLTPLRLSTIVNIYLGTLVDQTSPLGATIADLKLLTVSLFAAAVYSAGRLTNVLSENLSTIPANFIREAIEKIFMNTNSTDRTLVMVCKVIQQLAADFPVVREAFFQTLSRFNGLILHIYRAISNSFSEEKDRASRDDTTGRTRLEALLTLLFEICNVTVFVAEHALEEKMRAVKLSALLRIESHLTWLLVKLSRVPQLPVLPKAWKKVHLCINGVRIQKAFSDMDLMPVSSDSAPSHVLVCSCGGMRITDVSRRYRLANLVNSCRCKAAAWVFPELPELMEWISWEMYFESCIAEAEKSDDSSESIPEGNRIWAGWAQGVHAKSVGNLNSTQNEIVKLIFNGVLQSRAICFQTFKTASLEDIVRIPRNIKSLLRSITSTSRFSSVSWLYSILKRVMNIPHSDAEEKISKTTLNNTVLRLLFKQCIESLLNVLPRRHLYPLCADGAVPMSEVQSAEWSLGFLFAGKSELEECVALFPALACYTGHIGNMSRALHVDVLRIPRLAMLCTYVNAYEHRAAKVTHTARLTSTKERISSTFYLFDDDSNV